MKFSFLLILFLIFSFDANSVESSNIDSDLIMSNPKISNSDIKLSQFGGSATIITEDDINKSGANDIQDLLRKVPGLSIKQSGGRGGVVSIFSRGSESDHNLVVINGVKVNEIGGYYDFSRLSINNIKQIEILRGPQAILYGPGAMGLVVSITTKKYNNKNIIAFNTGFGIGESPSRGLQSDGGKYFINEQSVNIAGPLLLNNKDSYVKFGYSLGYKRTDDNGHMLRNNNHDKANLNAGLSLSTTDDKVNISASFDKMKLRYRYPTDSVGKIEGTPFLATQKDRRHITTRSINLEYKIIEHLTLGSTYKYWYMHKWVESGYQAWNGVETNSDTNFWEKREGFDYYIKHSTDQGILALDTLIGYDLSTESSDYNTFGGTYYGHEDKISQYYGNINIKLPYSININPGIRKIHHETHGGYTIPTIFLSKKIESLQTKLRGGYSKGIKYPNVYESYSQSFGLKPEKQKSYEFGVDQNIKQNIVVSATYFDTKISNLITYSGWITGTQSGAIYKNIQEASSNGFEFSMLINFPQKFQTKLWYTHLRTNVDKNGNFGGEANWPDNKDLLRRPRKSGGFSLNRSNTNYHVSFDGSYTGGRWDYESAEVRLWNKPFWNFDLYAEHNLNISSMNYVLKPYIKITNIFNDKRQEILNFDSPGRISLIGIKGEI